MTQQFERDAHGGRRPDDPQRSRPLVVEDRVDAGFVDAVAGTGAVILDTRKTLPGLRLAQKYAVRCGGGSNHRFGLHDAVMIKDTHLGVEGSISRAVARVLERPGRSQVIETLRAADRPGYRKAMMVLGKLLRARLTLLGLRPVI